MVEKGAQTRSGTVLHAEEIGGKVLVLVEGERWFVIGTLAEREDGLPQVTYPSHHREVSRALSSFCGKYWSRRGTESVRVSRAVREVLQGFADKV